MSRHPELGMCSVSGERRRHWRFPISAPVEWALKGRRGQAFTSDIGSGGAFLKTQNPLPVGEYVDLFLDWPAKLDGRCPLRLVIRGQVLRSGEFGSAVSILRSEYRLRPKTADHLAMVG